MVNIQYSIFNTQSKIKNQKSKKEVAMKTMATSFNIEINCFNSFFLFVKTEL